MEVRDRDPEEAFAHELAERLAIRLGDQVAPAIILEYARDAYRSLAEGARVHDFIPILGERDVLLRLRSG